MRIGRGLSISVKGEALIIVRRADTEEIIERRRIRNVITTGGLNVFAQALATPFITSGNRRYYWYLVLGTGTGTPSSSDTGLFSPVNISAKSGSITQTGNQVTYYVRYLPEEANGYTYTEAGIYDRVGYSDSSPLPYTNGVLINHLLITPALTKDSTKLVDFYIMITFS
jgi:hypothetical protein